MDDDLAKVDHMTNDQIVGSVVSIDSTVASDPKDDDDIGMKPVPAMSTIVQGLKTGLRWL